MKSHFCRKYYPTALTKKLPHLCSPWSNLIGPDPRLIFIKLLKHHTLGKILKMFRNLVIVTQYIIFYLGDQYNNSEKGDGTSLVAQWLRICLPTQGTRVRPLVQEDPTCRGATKPVRHNYWACALEPTSHNYWSPHALGPTCRNYWARELQLLKPVHLEPMYRNKRSHRNEKPAHRNEE